MKCWRCNAEIPDYALFCTHCGCRVREEAVQKKRWYEAEDDYDDEDDRYYDDYDDYDDDEEAEEDGPLVLEPVNEEGLKDPVFIGPRGRPHVESTWNSASWAAWQKKKESWDAWKKQRAAWNPAKKEEASGQAQHCLGQETPDPGQEQEGNGFLQEDMLRMFWERFAGRIAAAGILVIGVIVLWRLCLSF